MMIPDLTDPAPRVALTDDIARELAAERDLGSAMLAGYAETWAGDFSEFEVLGVEEAFLLPVVNPASDRASRYFLRAGVLDLRLRRRSTGGLVIVDHKSMAGRIDEFRNHLELDEQATGYWVAAEEKFGEPVEAFLYNGLVKAAPKPPRVVQAKAKADACACGRDLLFDDKTGKPKAHALSAAKNQATTLKLFTAAMAEHGVAPDDPRYTEILADLAANPTPYYTRDWIARTPQDLADYRADVYECSREMRTGRAYRNPDRQRCSWCEYRSICPPGRDGADVRATGFAVTTNRHAELDEAMLAETGKDVLSYSEIRTWKDCRKKHEFRFTDGLRPLVEARALRFGQGLHKCLAAWYSSLGKADMQSVWLAWFDAEFKALTGEPWRDLTPDGVNPMPF